MEDVLLQFAKKELDRLEKERYEKQELLNSLKGKDYEEKDKLIEELKLLRKQVSQLQKTYTKYNKRS